MIKYSEIFIFLLAWLLAGCSSHTPSQSTKKQSYQAMSARGDTLYAPKLNSQTQQKYEAALRNAQTTYHAHPDSTAALITYAQRTTDLGQYRKAIEIYNKGIEQHPGEPRLYLNRGQQFLITRNFDQAISDFQKAQKLMTENKPAPMLPTDIEFNLGLAQYLKRNFNKAASAFQQSLDASPNNEMRVKSSYWLYMSLRRAGMDLKAGKVLEPIEDDMNLTENQSYQKLLLVFKGDFKEKSLLREVESPLDSATIGYGLGNWHYINGRDQRAKALFQKVYESKNWAATGYIAAETELARNNFSGE